MKVRKPAKWSLIGLFIVTIIAWGTMPGIGAEESNDYSKLRGLSFTMDDVHIAGFEDEEADIWQTMTPFGEPDGYSFGRDDQVARNGMYSYAFSSDNTDADPENVVAIANNAPGEPAFEVEGGREYEVALSYLTEDYVIHHSDMGASVTIEAYDNESEEHMAAETYVIPEGTSADWGQLATTYTVPEEADRLRVNINFRAASGSVWVDDLTVAPNGLDLDRVHYSGFEDDEAEYWEEMLLYGMPDGYEMGRDDSFAHSGQYSYTFANHGQNMSDDPENVVGIANLDDGEPIYEVEGGQDYDVFISYFTENLELLNDDFGASITIEAYSSTEERHMAKRDFLLPSESSEEWEQFHAVYTVPNEADRLRINLAFRTATGQVWFDDVTVVPANLDVDAPDSYFVGFEDEEPDIWNVLDTGADGYEHGRTEAFTRSGEYAYTMSSTNDEADPGNQVAIFNNLGGTPNWRVEGGLDYDISLWYFTEDYERHISDLGATITLEAYDTATGSHMAREDFYIDPGTTDEWHELNVSYSVPEEADRLRMNLSFRAASGQIWFDDIAVHPLDIGDGGTIPNMDVVAGEENDVTIHLSDDEFQRLDTLDFGNNESEGAHQLEETLTEVGSGGHGGSEAFRTILPDGEMVFHMEVDPEQQNYFTVKLWGSDHGHGDRHSLLLEDPAGTIIRPDYLTDRPELDYMMPEPMAPGGYYYATYRLPRQMTNGEDSVQLRLHAGGYLNAYVSPGQRVGEQTMPSRGIYEAYTHVDPLLDVSNDAQGTIEPINEEQVVQHPAGISQFEHFKSQADMAVEMILSWQKYGEEWDAQVQSGVSPDLATGAITFFNTDLFEATEESWKNDHHQSRTIGSNATNMNAVVILARAFHGEWSDYYQDEELIERIVAALDYYVRAQGSDGSFVGNGWIGGPERRAGNNPLEGFGQKGIGETVLIMYDELEAAGYLDEMINHDHNPETEAVTRREAYTNMLEKGRDYMVADPGRRIANQQLANRTAMYLHNEALKQLDRERAWSDETVMEDLYYATGIYEHPDEVRPYTISPKGLAMEGNSYADVGGYDSNYGPHSVKFISDLAKWSEDPQLIERARDVTNAIGHYYNLQVDADGDTTLVLDGGISWRLNYSPGQVVYNPDPYVALQLQEPTALRQLHLYIQHGRTFELDFSSHDAHWLATLYEHLPLLDELDNGQVPPAGQDTRYLRQIVGSFHRSGNNAGETNTKLLNRFKPDGVLLPTEAAYEDYAWADEVAGTAIIQHDGHQIYLTPGWRAMDFANGLARAHHRTDEMSRIVNFTMSDPYGLRELYIAKYGDYVIIMNSSLEETYEIDIEGVYGEAVDLISGDMIDFSNTQEMEPLSTLILYLDHE